jgi:transglutaminase-like putative cysteine protease
MLEGLRYTIKAMIRAAKGKRRYGGDFPPQPMDSDNVSVFLANRLQSAGCKVRFKVVKQLSMQEFHHVYVEVWYPAGVCWLPLDPQQCDAKKFDKRVNINI